MRLPEVDEDELEELTDEHKPLPPPRTCTGGDEHQIGTTVCREGSAGWSAGSAPVR